MRLYIIISIIIIINQFKLRSSLSYCRRLTMSCATHTLRIIRKQPKYLITHRRTNDNVKFTSRDILNKLLQLKFFIQEKIRYSEITIFFANTEIREPQSGADCKTINLFIYFQFI